MAGSVDIPPQLRQDLDIYPVDPDIDGTPAWVLHDRYANRYFRIDEHAVELLNFVNSADAQSISAQATKVLGREVLTEQVEKLLHFLRINNLVAADEVQLDWYRRQSEKMSNPGWFGKLAKSYLFIRFPLWNPDSFLERTLPLVSWLGSRVSFYVIFLSALIGLYIVTRQVDSFLATFIHFFSLTGLSLYLVVLAITKILHELGHAYVAKAYGCRVPVIGVAFLVGWPVLYTDTTDAWKLASRRERMSIGIAGVAVELAIACISLLLWAFVADGPFRSVLFVLTTTTWLLSVMINFNPLMRFDGYYLLSDLLRMPNLEFRSFEMAKWWLREKLFAPGIEAAEPARGNLIGYAFSIWIYRFFLFLGIALLVYHFFFKALGIALFIVEMGYFIVRPLYREVLKWWELRSSMSWNYVTLRSVFILTLLLLVMVVPWNSRVVAPALMDFHYSVLYAPLAGRLQKLNVSPGQLVDEGEFVVQVEAPQLEHEVAQAERYYDELSWRRSSMGFDPEMRQQSLIVNAELYTQNQKLRGLIVKRDQLQLLAPISGVVVDISEDIAVGMWLENGEPLLAVRDDSELLLKAYVDERVINRIKPDMPISFYAEDPAWGKWIGVVDNVEQVGIRELDNLYMASLFGGAIAVREGEQQELLTQESVYLVTMLVEERDAVPKQVLRGHVVIKSDTESLFVGLYRFWLALFQRETGF
jgi:putative peptide zinc metalloprotease protein